MASSRSNKVPVDEDRLEGNGIAVQLFVDEKVKDQRWYDIYVDADIDESLSKREKKKPLAERMKEEKGDWIFDDKTGREVLEYYRSRKEKYADTAYPLRGEGIEIRRYGDKDARQNRYTIHIDPNLRSSLEEETNRAERVGAIKANRRAFGYSVIDKEFAPAAPITPCKDT